MKINLYIQGRNGSFKAEGTWDGEEFIVKKGHVSNNFAEHIQGGRKAKQYRENEEFVSKNGEIIKPCTFKSPSTAGQFVSGRSENGYKSWKLEDGRTLDAYLKEKGLR